MQKKLFCPGFRLSILDTVFLIMGLLATVILGNIMWWWGFVVGFVVGHFFLFCNVFRLARSLELIWSIVFIITTSCTVILQTPSWTTTVCISFSATILFVVIEMRRPSYHGIAWKKINPGLENWWKARNSSKEMF